MLVITEHARKRMREYSISEKSVEMAVNNPDLMFEGHDDRKIYSKNLDAFYALRVIVEEYKEVRTVITVYKARSVRYEI